MNTQFSQTGFVLLLLALSLPMFSCGTEDDAFDAQGVFEGEEVIVSSEMGGKILQFDVEEGGHLKANTVVALIDTSGLVLQKNALQAQIRAVLSQTPDAAAQIAALSEQISAAKRESARIEPLVSAGALPTKQLDDARTQVQVLEKQLRGLQSSLDVTQRGLRAQTEPLAAQIAQVNDQIGRCSVVNPVEGTVLVTYAEPGEVAGPGKPLYKIADLSTLTLRAYIDGESFSRIKLGDTARVFVDDGPEQYREIPGHVVWISDEAEFTPKTIRTKDERSNLVYAAKIAVPNDGRLKIGMYGEVKF